MILRYRTTACSHPVEADSSDSNGEQHDQACEGNANADVPGDGGHHEARDGDKDVQQHLSKTPLSLGPKPGIFRRIGQFQKCRRGMRVSGSMRLGGGEVKSPNHRDAIPRQHAKGQVFVQ
jgi:hypothetical protein